METSQSANAAISFIEATVNAWISRLLSYRDRHRAIFLSLSIAAIILSAGTTLLIGVEKIIGSSVFSILALVTSATVTVINGLTALLRSREQWVSTGSAVRKLVDLDTEIKYRKTLEMPFTKHETDALLARLREIIGDLAISEQRQPDQPQQIAR